MAGTFRFELVTPERMLVSQDASQVIVPGVEGEFTVLPGHAPVISALRPGVVDAALGDTRRIKAFVKGGFAEVEAGRLTILADRAIDIESAGAGALAEELRTAERELAAATTDKARLAASSAVAQLRALQR
jgi:F-type H+-transporting ATPase subunit epsilon